MMIIITIIITMTITIINDYSNNNNNTNDNNDDGDNSNNNTTNTTTDNNDDDGSNNYRNLGGASCIGGGLGAKHRTPEISTSEIIVDLRGHFPTEFRFFQWYFSMDFHFCDFWCVIFCPEGHQAAARGPRGASAAPSSARRRCTGRRGSRVKAPKEFSGRQLLCEVARSGPDTGKAGHASGAASPRPPRRNPRRVNGRAATGRRLCGPVGARRPPATWIETDRPCSRMIIISSSIVLSLLLVVVVVVAVL